MHWFCSNYIQTGCCSQLNAHPLETSGTVSDGLGAVAARVHVGLHTFGNHKLFLCSYKKEAKVTMNKHSHGSNRTPEQQNLVWNWMILEYTWQEGLSTDFLITSMDQTSRSHPAWSKMSHLLGCCGWQEKRELSPQDLSGTAICGWGRGSFFHGSSAVCCGYIGDNL